MKATVFFLLLVSYVFAQPYDPSMAKRALMYAYASYCPLLAIQSQNCYWCTQTSPLSDVKVVYDSNTNTQAYVGHDGGTIWVSVRGTQVQSIVNWIDNAEFFLTPLWNHDSSVEVHSGFKKGFVALYPSLNQTLSTFIKNQCRGCPVWITGHSLGAAIANMMSVQIAYDYNIKVNELNFGCPRTGNQAFEQYHQRVSSYSIRVTNKKDIVPRVPTHVLTGYQHCPTEVWYMPQGGYKTCNGSGEDPSCSLSIPFDQCDITDHLQYLGIDLRTGGKYGC